MANIGDILTNPESGYQRISCLNLNVKYTGSWTYEAKNTYSLNVSDYVEFYFYGTKIELCNALHSSHSQNVTINLDGTEENFSQYQSSSTAQYYTLCYKKEGLEKKIHKVKIYSTETSAPRMSTIDIDEDGYMIYCDSNNKLYYDMTPIMTGDNVPSPYVASASSVYNNYAAYKAFDGSINSMWISGLDKITNQYLRLSFAEKTRINALLIKTDNSSNCPKDFILKGSNEDNVWEEIYRGTFTKNNKEENFMQIFNFDISNYKSYELFFINNQGNTGDGGGRYIDIVELSYLLEINTPFYLIKDNEIYKNYDETTDTLVEVSDVSILKTNVLENTCISNLKNIIPHLDDLSDNIKLISNQNNKIIVDGIKSNKELVIGKSSFSTRIANNIDYFKMDEDATAKVIFSIDDGATWKTYESSTSSFKDLEISIPIGKVYKDFTNDEKTAWDNAITISYNQGIDSTILNTIDFNSLKAEKIKFGYVLTATDTETMNKMKNLIWQFDSKGVMELVDAKDVKQQLYYGGVKLVSNVNADMLKVNITYEGIGGSDNVYTEEDVLNSYNNIIGGN